MSNLKRPFFRRYGVVVLSVTVVLGARGQFLPTSAGVLDYNAVANWTGNTPNGTFTQTPSSLQEITFGTDTTLATGLTFDLGGVSPVLILRSDGAGDRILTLGAGITVNGGNSSGITIGSVTAGQGLTLDLGGAMRTFGVASGNTLTVTNAITGTGGSLKKNGGGLLVLAGQSSYDGNTSVDVGTLKTTIANALPTTAVSLAAGATLALEEDQKLADLTGAGTVSIAAGKTLMIDTASNLQFDGTLTGAGAFSLCADDGGSLNLTGDNTYSGGTTVERGVLIALNANGSATGTGAITVDGYAKLQIGGGGAVGSVTGNVAVAADGNVMFARSNALTYGGVITGAGTLTVDGVGPVTLTGANTLTGDTKVNANATLVAGAQNTLSAMSAVYVSGNGTLDVNFSQTIAALESGLSGGSAMVDVASGATLTVNVGSGGDELFEGVISGAGAIVKSGAGKQTFSGANTYGGGTSVSGGTLVVTNTSGSGTGAGAVSVSNGAILQIGDGAAANAGAVSGAITNNGTLLFNRPGTLTQAGVISGGGQVSVAAGTVTLTGANTYNGGTTVDAGSVLVLGNTLGATLATGADVTLNGTGELHVDENQTTRAVKGDSTSKVVIAASKALTINLPDASDPTHTAATYDGTISGDGSLVVGGPGTFTLTGTNDYSGGTVLNSGTLVVASDAALGATGGQISSGTLRGGRGFGGVRALSIGEGGRRTLGGAPTGGLTFNGGALRVGSGFTSERAITLGANGGTVDTNTYQLTLSGTITGAGKLTHQGTGVLTLSGSNDYTGGTKVKGGGVLDFTADDNLGTGSVELDGGFLRTRAAIADFTHDLLLAAGGGNLNTYGFDSTFSGTITGAGGLTVQSQTGSGVLTLTGANQYAGATVVQSGTLKIGADDTLPTDNAVTISSGGTLDVGANQSLNSLTGAGTMQVASGKLLTLKTSALFGSVISGAGGVKFENGNSVNGLTTLTASQTYTGTTTVSVGKLQLGNASGPVTVAGPVSTGSGTTLIFSHGAGNSTMSSSISGGGSLMKNNSGTLTLTGNNSYTGSTTVAGGTLKAGAANALPSGTGLSLGAGTMLDVAASQTINRFLATDATSSILLESGQLLTVALGSNPGSGTQFNGTISGAGGLKISDAGGFTVALTGDNTYTGGTTIDANAGLWIGSGGTTGMIAGNVVNNGTLLFARTDKVTFGGVISGSGVVKQTTGSGTLEFTAANTFSGGTLLYGWLLAKNSSGSATGTGSVAVYSGGLLGGNGTVSGPVSVNSGGTVGPGTALGTPAELHVGATTFAGGGVFAFQIKDATGSAGGDYSLLSSSGALTIAATSGNPFTISVYSVNGTTQGTTANFDSTHGYSWTFVSAANGIAGFDAAAFQVSTANFQNAFTGSFGISQAGNSLLLNYTPAAVPEPATWALLGLGLGGVWWWRRRGVMAGRGR